jgi:hypothetical protein
LKKSLIFVLVGVLFVFATAHASVKQSNDATATREPVVIATPQVQIWNVDKSIHIVVIIQATRAALPAPVLLHVAWKGGREVAPALLSLSTIASPVRLPGPAAVKAALDK